MRLLLFGLCGLLVLGFSMKSQAAKPVQFEVSSQLFIDGKLVASPNIGTLSGMKASVAEHDANRKEVFRLEVTPSELVGKGPEKAVLLKFQVAYDKDGRKIKASPQFSIIEGQHATISLSESPADRTLASAPNTVPNASEGTTGANEPTVELRVIAIRK